MLALLVAVAAAVAAGAALYTARGTLQRQQGFEAELARRQQASDTAVTETRSMARQAQDGALAAQAKAALVEARVSEVVVQRSQFDDLIQSLSRSRDESVLIDIEAALRFAQQQATITGSVEPLLVVLRQSQDRLERLGEPRLEGVRQAIGSDLERIRGVGVTDLAAINQRLSDAVRLVDDLPLLSQAARQRQADAMRLAVPAAAAPVAGSAAVPAAAGASAASAPAVAASRPAPAAVAAASAPSTASAVAPASAGAASAAAIADAASAATPAADAVDAADDPAPRHWTIVQQAIARWASAAWGELRSLVRVSRVDNADAMLVAPEQSYFIRENLKLRLLNARLSILSRQFDAAQSDLQAARETVARYFDRESRQVLAVEELLRQVAQQARQTTLPRPEETLSAVAAAGGPR